MSAGEHRPLPVLDDLSRVYWGAACEGRLLLQRCQACGEHQFYPRRHCVHCFAPDPDWVEAKGTGRLHTFSVVHRTSAPGFAGDVPYVFAVVELDEGPRLTANVLDTPLDELACDLPVRVVFTRVSDEIALPNVTRREG
jgi:uncharacterized OB-fold protein